ncbi:hypothetical protein P3X46_012140 [Hevea brasiliensis]|uniref:Uncharacterized protein n=1 Tax=Hevea brasiliensis TaxID=3981 RepID=A0ABQ9M9B1_HEVBR|nr:hypothetical protein P3X46_012140 [Hevea brasiliensis]
MEVEEVGLYNVKVERKVSQKRLAELGFSRCSAWKTGKRRLPWDWQVDQLAYVEGGEESSLHQVVEADLFFNGPCQERYSFRAYGDDC